jgi:26S proteasome regulatory subunit N3
MEAEQEQQQVQTVGALPELRDARKLLERAVPSKDTRLAGRSLRHALSLRKRLTTCDIAALCIEFVTSENTSSALLSAVGSPFPPPDVDSSASSDCPAEVSALAGLLGVAFLLDSKSPSSAAHVSSLFVSDASRTNRRTLDPINARLLQIYSLAHERCNSLSSIRDDLVRLYRTAVLRHDNAGQEVLVNLVIRNFLKYSLFEQAEKFRSKAQRPEVQTNQQACRYLFYLGQIRAVQLEYSEAKESLSQALRKAPQIAKGFRLQTVKWLSVVRLLLGEIPERSLFMQPGMCSALKPYYDIANAVRLGDVTEFQRAAKQYTQVLERDGLINLVNRLHRNVVRVGLRRINLAYSRISLGEIAKKLQLASADDAENIVSKAIKDGALEASIGPHGHLMESHPPTDVYSTTEPQSEFHARISYCLNLHNDALKAMRFPRSRRGPKGESQEQRRERVLAEEEIMQMEDDDFDDALF